MDDPEQPSYILFDSDAVRPSYPTPVRPSREMKVIKQRDFDQRDLEHCAKFFIIGYLTCSFGVVLTTVLLFLYLVCKASGIGIMNLLVLIFELGLSLWIAVITKVRGNTNGLNQNVYHLRENLRNFDINSYSSMISEEFFRAIFTLFTCLKRSSRNGQYKVE